ncbi:MAG: LytR/AlgR family response regulator transcription factor [Planctomycetaceae bacterium]
MITALLVDDEPKAIERLAELLESFPGVDVIGTARDVGDAERFLAGRAPDVVFLDINMPGRLGFDLVASVPAATRIVFVTAHEDRAVEAFRAGAVDYLLKPVDRDRLGITIERLEERLPAVRSAAVRAGSGDVTDDEDAGEASGDTADEVTFSLSGGRGFESVAYADIVWVEAVRNYTRVQARDRRPRIIRRTMAEWEAMLPAATFGRVSRSLIVQLPAIRSMQWQSRDQTLVFFGNVPEPLPIGRAATARLKDLLPT